MPSLGSFWGHDRPKVVKMYHYLFRKTLVLFFFGKNEPCLLYKVIGIMFLHEICSRNGPFHFSSKQYPHNHHSPCRNLLRKAKLISVRRQLCYLYQLPFSLQLSNNNEY